ncbi:hypothetical protein [Rhodopirellula sp. MGV]|uniref:hypothetical protein n=1 Tax=Rhodopirellula sp. MGV TaxID=2023130 RepID=UPI000B966AEB|nr:hypothetical protein [Rhodopirellula sp. MGV]OYP35377.1 hypothetical protein CGZ80_11955 [Rhodopirellula sp. MGV]PNY37735.1 hypothetical protein C2E31_06265 [Rhodopirellula baltica]
MKHTTKTAPTSLHFDRRWMDHYAAALRTGSGKDRLAYLSDLSEEIFRRIDDSAKNKPAITFKIYSLEHDWAEDFIATPPSGIAFGAAALLRLDQSLRLLSRYLFDQFLSTTQSPFVGSTAPLPSYCTPEEFSLKALRFASPAGRAPRGIQYAMTNGEVALQQADAAPDGMLKLRDFAPPIVSIPSTTKSFAEFLESASTEEPSHHFSHEQPSPYHLLLYHRLMVDTLAFLIGHEVGHHRLAHFDQAPNDERARTLEIEADRFAMEYASKLPGFEMRSVLGAFTYLQGLDQRTRELQMSHPFARDRLAIFANAAGRYTTDEQLISDINASLSSLAKSVPVSNDPAWHDELSNDFSIHCIGYSDLDYAFEVRIDIDYLHESSSIAVSIDNSLKPIHQLLQNASFVFDIALVDQTHPTKVYCEGRATLIVGSEHRGWANLRGTEQEVKARLLAPSRMIASFPDGVLIARSVQVQLTPHTADATGRIDYQWHDADVGEHVLPRPIGHHPSPGALPKARDLKLLQAQRSRELYDLDSAITEIRCQFYERGDRDYQNTIWLVDRLRERGEIKESAEIASRWLAESNWPGPGMYFALAQQEIAFRKGSHRCYDYLFIEERLFPHSTYGSQCAELAAQHFSQNIDDPFLGEFMDAMQSHQPGVQLCMEGRYREAMPLLEQSHAAMRAVSEHAPENFVFVRQLLAEMRLALELSRDQDWDACIELFEQVAELCPHFVPAITEQAKVYLEEKQFVKCESKLQEAASLIPSHAYVHEVQNGLRIRMHEFCTPLLDAGITALMNCEYDSCIGKMDAAITAAPMEEGFWKCRGTAKWCAGDFVGAAQDFTNSMTIAGLESDMLVKRGFALTEGGNPLEGLVDFDRMLALARVFQVEEEIPLEFRSKVLAYTSIQELAFCRAGRALALALLDRVDEAEAEIEAAKQSLDGGFVSAIHAEIARKLSQHSLAQQLASQSLRRAQVDIPQRLIMKVNAFIADANHPIFVA